MSCFFLFYPDTYNNVYVMYCLPVAIIKKWVWRVGESACAVFNRPILFDDLFCSFLFWSVMSCRWSGFTLPLWAYLGKTLSCFHVAIFESAPRCPFIIKAKTDLITSHYLDALVTNHWSLCCCYATTEEEKAQKLLTWSVYGFHHFIKMPALWLFSDFIFMGFTLGYPYRQEGIQL